MITASDLTVTTPDLLREAIKAGTHKIRAMLYAGSGTGKSSMASTFPGVKGVIDADNGAMVYSGSCRIVQVPEDSLLDKAKPVAWETACAALDMFCKDDSVDTIIADSFTTLADACMKHVMASVGRSGQPPTFVEWSRQMDLLREFIFKAFGSRKNVINIFHEEMEKDELSGQVWCRPLITGKMSAKVPNYHDEVYHLEPQASTSTKDAVYQVRTKATRMYVAKSRLDKVVKIPEIMPADFSAILAHVQRGLG